jgi:hypothetical protein
VTPIVSKRSAKRWQRWQEFEAPVFIGISAFDALARDGPFVTLVLPVCCPAKINN